MGIIYSDCLFTLLTANIVPTINNARSMAITIQRIDQDNVVNGSGWGKGSGTLSSGAISMLMPSIDKANSNARTMPTRNFLFWVSNLLTFSAQFSIPDLS